MSESSSAYNQLISAFKDLYGQQPLNQSQFLGVMRQLQDHHPLLNYPQTSLFQHIYSELSSTLPSVTLTQCLDFTTYLVMKNRQAILQQDLVFYEALVGKMEEDGVREINSRGFSEMLKEKKDLNQGLKQSLLKCFANVRVVSVRKLGRLVRMVREELGGGESGGGGLGGQGQGLGFVTEFDVAKSVYASGSMIDKSMVIMEQSSTSSDLQDNDFLLKNRQLLDYIQYQCSDPKLQNLAQQLKQKQSHYQSLQQSTKSQLQTHLHQLSEQKRQLQQYLEQQRVQKQMLGEHVEHLQRQLERVNKSLDGYVANKAELMASVREMNRELAGNRVEIMEYRQRVKAMSQQNQMLRSNFKQLLETHSQLQTDNHHLNQLLTQKPNSQSFQFDERTSKQQLQDANTKLSLLQQRCDSYQAKIEYYQRKIEQLEFQVERLQAEAELAVSKMHVLGEEGVRQSGWMGSRYCERLGVDGEGNEGSRRNGVEGSRYYERSVLMRSKMSVMLPEGKQSEVQQFKISVIPAENNEPIRSSVMQKSRLKSSAMHLSPEYNYLRESSKINSIIDNSKSSLALQLNLSPAATTQSPVQSSPSKDLSQSPSTSRFLKSKPQLLHPTFDENEQFYKHDYSQARDLPSIQSLLQKDKDSCEYTEKYFDKRFRFLSCDVHLIRSTGEDFKYILIITCGNIYLVDPSKYQKRDTVKISQIRKVLMGENSYLLVIRFGGKSDYMLLTNRRRELVGFLGEVRQWMGADRLQVEKYFTNQNLVVIQDRKELELTKFRRIFSPYTSAYEYFQFCSSVYLEFKRQLIGTYYKLIFLIANYSGLYFLEDDVLETKHDFKDKLILYLPILQDLTTVIDKNDKILKLRYSRGTMPAYQVKCRSKTERDELMQQIGNIRKVMGQRKKDLERGDREAVVGGGGCGYREVD